MTGRLANRVAVVTGAASGIGRATALIFAREGAAVVCSDIHDGPPVDGSADTTTHQEIQSLGGRAIFVACDTSQSAQVQALVKAAVAEFGRLDIMFNNAGISREADRYPSNMIWESDEQLFDLTMAINVKGVYLGCKYAVAQMKDQEPLVPGGDRGWIVNTSSIMGLNSMPGIPAYTTSKHAVMGLTKAVAMDCAPFNIHVNSVNPGFTRTGMIHKILDEGPAMDNLMALHPLKGVGKADDVAKAVLFLVSDDASWITGEHICVDGGYNVK